MKYDIILSGVGGQGVLSLATIIAVAAQHAGLKVRQSEVHGMAQRGGSVLAHLRLSDQPIMGDLIPKGGADLILGMEPLESLRYLDYLAPAGTVVSGTDPVKNIGNYPELEPLLAQLHALADSGCRLLPANDLAREAGHLKSANMVLVGAASNLLPLGPEHFSAAIRSIFGRKGEAVVALNEKAFAMGHAAGNAPGCAA